MGGEWELHVCNDIVVGARLYSCARPSGDNVGFVYSAASLDFSSTLAN